MGSEQTTNRFLLEVDASIIAANRKAISNKVGTVTRQRFEVFARRVADLRADYLAAAFEHPWSEPTAASDDMADKRQRYEEAVAAFEALERAVRRGYVEIR